MAIMQTKSKKQFVYEIFMIILAACSVATIWQSTKYDSYIVWITWAIFFVDFVYRFLRSKHKWQFIKGNPFLLIAAIPLDAVFQFARLARILHLLRLKTITKYYTKPFLKVLRRQHIGAIFSVTMVLVFVSIIPLYYFEPELTSYWDALLGGLMSLAFFGQADFDPITAIGQVTVVLLTVVGVILHGLVISAAFDYIYHAPLVKKSCKKESKNRQVRHNFIAVE
ncbi:hypothetical protein [Sediminibacillus halophilus]|uniref:Voltage-gated potassium channel n=1 Tax=Sediminibacillus halophilus TaxID=482461 RepID=A0A1G9THH5_9BACI|nr:hypothetical protein [Sediminibacillus halophilus]SDM47171.1 voltage-gated potassium channel [Sediminibacillus halophilus]